MRRSRVSLTLGEIAEATGAEPDGEPGRELHGVCSLENPHPEALGFLEQSSLPEEFESGAVGALIVRPEEAEQIETRLEHPEPRRAFAGALELWAERDPGLANQFDSSFGDNPDETDIHPDATVHESAELGKSVSIGPGCVIEAGASVGDGCKLLAQVYIGRGASLGERCRLLPGVRVLARVELGNGVTVGANSVIGGEGFGFVSSAEGHEKMQHVGSVRIGDGVELGSSVCVDRGVIDDTEIGAGSKLDNLIQVGHNVRLGPHTLVAAQAGFSGSAEAGSFCVFGGQAGIGGHLTIGDQVTVGGQSGVMGDVEDGKKVSGYPAVEHGRSIRAYAALQRLPELRKQVRQLEQQIEELKSNSSTKEKIAE